jgi:2'-5' RNA ligase
LRCFIAVELSPSVKEVLLTAGTLIRELDADWAGEKWVTAETMHLTLRFLGELDASAVNALSEEFGFAAAGIAPFELRFNQLKAMPRSSRASMIWATTADETGRRRELAQEAEFAAKATGIVRASHTFNPHVTLVRARRPRQLLPGTLAQVARVADSASWPTMSVLSVTLYSSTLTRTGPTHKALGDFTLGVEQQPF